MRHQHHSDSTNANVRREASWIAALISGLDRRSQLLDQDIAAEEERDQAFYPSHPAYPILARTLTVRRDNLRRPLPRWKSDLAFSRRFAE
jgi:hypothetical protein